MLDYIILKHEFSFEFSLAMLANIQLHTTAQTHAQKQSFTAAGCEIKLLAVRHTHTHIKRQQYSRCTHP